MNINTIELTPDDMKTIIGKFNSFLQDNKSCYFTTIGDYGYEIKGDDTNVKKARQD